MIHSYFDIHDVCMEEEKIPVTFVVPSFNIGRAVGATTEHKSNSNMISSSNNNKDKLYENRNNSNNNSEVAVGSKVLMPLWAAIALRKKAYVQVSLPASFSHSAFRQFKMDPLVPNLYIMSPYYYEVGLMLCRLIGNPPLSAITAAANNYANVNNSRRRSRNENNDVNSNSTREMALVNVLSIEGRRLANQLFRLYQLRYLRVILSSAKCGFDRADVREKLCEMERELFDSVLKGKAEEHIWRDRLIEKDLIE